MTFTSPDFSSDYAVVNGLRMYYEIHGVGRPLVLIHGGGSTLESTFAQVIPLFAGNRQVIAVELQAHGRTADRDADLSFEQDADDAAALLTHLGIDQADVLGFSNGGTTALQMALRHPQMVRRLILASALARRDGMPDWFWGFMENASLQNMPQALQEAYLKVAPDPAGLQIMHDRDAFRMVHFRDIPTEKIQALQVPTLIINGDQDVVTPDHALWLQRQIPNSRLAILPGGHGEYLGEITTLKAGFRAEDLLAVRVVEMFLQGEG
ncbi:MAG: alpha/beta hydrolase [Bacteroidia bacterium]|nr:alpha/beta hydrolase [Bacteroidia bacterium]